MLKFWIDKGFRLLYVEQRVQRRSEWLLAEDKQLNRWILLLKNNWTALVLIGPKKKYIFFLWNLVAEKNKYWSPIESEYSIACYQDPRINKYRIFYSKNWSKKYLLKKCKNVACFACFSLNYVMNKSNKEALETQKCTFTWLKVFLPLSNK